MEHVNLVKGQRTDLTKGNPGLNNVLVGLGWDVNRYDGDSFDLDASVFLLAANEKVRKANDFVFFNNMRHESGAVVLSGDNRTGEGSGDDEKIKIDLSKIPTDIEKIDIVITIYDAANRLQNFGMVANAFVRVVDEATNKELLRFDLSEESSTKTGVVMGRLYRYNSEWKFQAVGDGYDGGLEAICSNYGIQ